MLYSTMSMLLQQLQRFAAKRLHKPAGPSLQQYVHRHVDLAAIFADLLIPEDMTLGYYTPWYNDLSDAEKLALNHWVYFLHYSRIVAGEQFVHRSNAAVASCLSEAMPVLSQLLLRENAEERDHMAAFQPILHAIAAYYQFGPSRLATKPAQQALRSQRLLHTLSTYFGADYIATYFLGRGIINHMGNAFERAIARLNTSNHAVHYLSHLHAIDESKHMAASRYFASAARELVPTRGQSGRLYDLLHYGLRKISVTYTFSERLTKRQEKAMSYQVIPRMPVFRARPHAFLAALIEGHFTSLSGVERAKNAVIGKGNQAILDQAALSTGHKEQWLRWMRADCGNLCHFPSAYQIVAGSRAA